MVKKLILDCDPGIDDALALIAACKQRQAEVLGVSVVAGNLPLETVTANASAILAFMNSPARVYPGATGPLYGKLQDASDIHGPGGLGGWRLEPDAKRVDSCHAAEFMARTAAAFPGQVTLVTLGPLTNLALALEHHPRELQKLAAVVIMGGALTVPGNVTPAAEYNIWADPDAAQLVLSSDLDLTMVGLDVTANMRLENEDIRRLTQGGPVARGAARLIEYIVREQGEYPFHDPLAFTAAVQPDYFAFDTVPVAVEPRGAICRGRTVADYSGRGNYRKVKVAIKADYGKCRRLLIDLWTDSADK